MRGTLVWLRASLPRQIASREFRGTLFMVREEPEKVAVGVRYDELPITAHAIVLPVPALLEGDQRCQIGRKDTGVQRVDVVHFDLEVHAATVRIFKRGGAEQAVRKPEWIS
jgi:hypothetical protein